MTETRQIGGQQRDRLMGDYKSGQKTMIAFIDLHWFYGPTTKFKASLVLCGMIPNTSLPSYIILSLNIIIANILLPLTSILPGCSSS